MSKKISENKSLKKTFHAFWSNLFSLTENVLLTLFGHRSSQRVISKSAKRNIPEYRKLKTEKLEERALLSLSITSTGFGSIAENTAESVSPIISFTRDDDLFPDCVIHFQLEGTASSEDFIIKDGSNELITLSTGNQSGTNLFHYTGSLTLSTNQGSGSLRFCPVNDAQRETNETVTVTISGYTYMGQYYPTSYSETFVIVDNDHWFVQAAATDSDAGEVPSPEQNYGEITISRSGETDFTHPLDVYFYISGTATYLSDYTFNVPGNNNWGASANSSSDSETYPYCGHLRIEANQSSVTIEAKPINDNLREWDETVVISIYSPDDSESLSPTNDFGYEVTGDPAVVTIDDNDQWVVVISAGDENASETQVSGEDTGYFNIVRCNESDLTWSLTMSFILSGSAAYNNDYILSAPTNANLSIESAPSYDARGEFAGYRGTITIASGQTSVIIRVRPKNDSAREDQETVDLQMSIHEVYDEFSRPLYTLVPDLNQATVYINDNDDWKVSIIAVDSIASEENGGTSNYGQYRISRFNEEDTTYSLPVYLQASGSATTQDYELYLCTESGDSLINVTPRIETVNDAEERIYTWSVVIPAHAFNVTVELRPVDDHYAESDETVVMSIRPNSRYEIDPTNSQAEIVIEEETYVWLTREDDVVFEASDLVNRGSSRIQYVAHVYTTEDDWRSIRAQLAVSGSGTLGGRNVTGDYYLTKNPTSAGATLQIENNNGNSSAELVIQGNQTETSFYLVTEEDDLFEFDESVLLELASAFCQTETNQIEVRSNPSVQTPVTILQAPEFISGSDSDFPETVNDDVYVAYVNRETPAGTLLSTDRPIIATIPSDREIRYAIVNTDSVDYYTIDEFTGEITLSETFASVIIQLESETFTLTIKAYDSENPNLYDLSTITINVYRLDFVRVFDSNQPSNRSTRAVIRDNEDSVTIYEDNPRSDYDVPDEPGIDEPGIVLGCWDSRMTFSSIEIEIGVSETCNYLNRILWKVNTYNGCEINESNASSGSYANSLNNKVSITVVPSLSERLEHNERNDVVIMVGFDINGNNVLDINETNVIFKNRLIGKNEYDACLNKFSNIAMWAGSAIYPCTIELLSIFLNRSEANTEGQRLDDIDLDYSTYVDQSNGLGFDSPELTHGTIPCYFWNSNTTIARKIRNSDLFFENIIAAPLEDLNISSFYEESPNEIRHTFTQRIETSLFFDEHSREEDLENAIGHVEIDVLVSIDTEKYNDQIFITSISLNGVCTDVYDMQTRGTNSRFGAASRLQTCHRAGVRDEGRIFKCIYSLNHSTNLIIPGTGTFNDPIKYNEYDKIKSYWTN